MPRKKERAKGLRGLLSRNPALHNDDAEAIRNTAWWGIRKRSRAMPLNQAAVESSKEAAMRVGSASPLHRGTEGTRTGAEGGQ
jgi:hypothetical protein